jgi:uncharacterized protein
MKLTGPEKKPDGGAPRPLRTAEKPSPLIPLLASPQPSDLSMFIKSPRLRSPAPSMPTCPPAARREIAPGVILDARRALVNVTQGWMAVADIHFGYEVRRSRGGALMPDWGMAQCETLLLALLRDHHPQRLILVGDIMDGGASAEETLALLDRLREQVPLICVEGNHDRVGLRRGRTFVKSHREDGYLFEHGHLPLSEHSGVVITGHEHPSVRFRDGAGLQLRLPALIQEQTSPKTQRWILPAFSPWAAGGKYESAHERVGTWVCAPGRVWSAL